MDVEQELRNLDRILTDENAEPIQLSYEALRRITNSFSEVIGSGGFGVVYMGTLRNGRVAVKKLSRTNEFSEQQFENELLCLMNVKDTNIVRFLGYCSDPTQEVCEYNGQHVLAERARRFLCFEYVPNKSLEEHLKDKSHLREWDTCYRIIEGICHGLRYLHNKERIIHLDLKPANILIDADMVPKITDFGLSRRFGAEQSRTITRHIIGTREYLAPEYIDNGELSFKSDIYSFGIIVRKLLTGSSHASDENWQNSLVPDNPQVKRCIDIAQRCVDANQRSRPTVDEIIGWLNMQPHLKTSWPELVGMPATAAVTQIYQDVPGFAVEVHPPGSHLVPGDNPKRVRVHHDEHGCVARTPYVG